MYEINWDILSTDIKSIIPDRDEIINQEDIINLKIELNTCRTLEEFLKRT